MQDFTSFLAVIAIWIAVSVFLWWLHRSHQRRFRQRQRALTARISARLLEAQGIFDAIRAAPPIGGQDQARQETSALLRRLQDHGGYFDAARAFSPQIRSQLALPDCPPLSELLQIRRDLWAASEIILVEDLETLGDAFTEAGSYERFCRDAQKLLFKGAAEAAGEDDLIDVRLALARADMEQFAKDVERGIDEAEEKERLPTPAEIISYPVATARAVPGQIRVARAAWQDTAEQVRLAARAIRESGTVAGALEELRRAREELPARLAASLERAAGLARHGRESIAAHHAFLIKAYDLQTKYQDVLSRAPEISERGRQFIARLEIAKRSEQLRETSQGVLDDMRRGLVHGLAHIIAALQQLQETLSPEPRPAGAAVTIGMRAHAPRPQFLDGAPAKPALAAKPAAAPQAALAPVFPAPASLPESLSPKLNARLTALFRKPPPARPRVPDLDSSAPVKEDKPLRLPAPQPAARIAPPAGALPQTAPPLVKEAAKPKPFWPVLEEMRRKPEKAPPPAAPDNADKPRAAKKPDHAAQAIEARPAKTAAPHVKETVKKPGSIASMLRRLEREAETQQPPKREPASLKSKLAALTEGDFNVNAANDGAAAGSTASPAPAEKAGGDAPKPRRFSLFGGRKD